MLALEHRTCADGGVQQAITGQHGLWMGAAKTVEARRRVRTSAFAPPCGRLEGGATIICARVWRWALPLFSHVVA
jgi:hypothetical protein